MSLPDNPICTAEDYWNLPEGERAELIDGQLYALASPSRIHQEIIIELTYHFQHYIKSNKGNCKIYAAPFAGVKLVFDIYFLLYYNLFILFYATSISESN